MKEAGEKERRGKGKEGWDACGRAAHWLRSHCAHGHDCDREREGERALRP